MQFYGDDSSELARRHTTYTLAIAGLAALFFSGCIVGPDYKHPPTSPVADAFPEAQLLEESRNAETVKANTVEIEPIEPEQLKQLDQWWAPINDPVLDYLIQQTLAGDYDLQIAAERICEARSSRGVVVSGLFPQIATDASYAHEKLSSGLNSIAKTTSSTVRDRWTWGTDLNWELDVFGKLHRLVEAADANIGESVEYYRDTMVMLTAETGTTYVELRALQQQIDNVERNIETQKQSARLAWALFEKGKTSKLDAVQADASLRTAEAELPTLHASLRLAVNRLNVLVGLPPGELDEMLLTQGPIPTPPSCVAQVIPAELLRRRPDIRLAERKVAGETARIGAAVADLYPQFSISGTFGLDARHFSQLFDSDSINAGVGPSMRWNILNFGKYQCNIAAQESRQRQAIGAYRQTVLIAAEEVDNAIALYAHEMQRQAKLQEVVAANATALELSQKLYEVGKADFQRVLDSQQNLLSSELRHTQSKADILRDLILLYRAMGGGWDYQATCNPPYSSVP